MLYVVEQDLNDIIVFELAGDSEFILSDIALSTCLEYFMERTFQHLADGIISINAQVAEVFESRNVLEVTISVKFNPIITEDWGNDERVGDFYYNVRKVQNYYKV